MKSLKASFASSGKWLVATTVVSTCLQMAAGIILARLIEPYFFGEFLYLLAWSEGLTLLAGFGFNTSILQNELHPKEEFQNFGFWITLIPTVFYLGAGLTVSWLAGTRFPELFALMFLARAFSMSAGVHGLVLQRAFRFKAHSLLNLFGTVLGILVGTGLALLSYKCEALIAQYLVAQIAMGALLWFFSPFSPEMPKMCHFRYLATFVNNGKHLFVSQMIEKILANLDKVVIGRALGNQELAYIFRARALPQRTLGLFTSSLTPLVTVTFAQMQSGNVERTEYAFRILGWATSRSSTLIVFVAAATAEEWLPFIYGRNWTTAAYYLPFLAIFLALDPVKRLLRAFLNSHGAFADLRRIQSYELCLFGSALLCGAYLQDGAAVCMSLSMVYPIVIFLYATGVRKYFPVEAVSIILFPAIFAPITLFIVLGIKATPTLQNMQCLARGSLACLATVLLLVLPVAWLERNRLRMLFSLVSRE